MIPFKCLELVPETPFTTTFKIQLETTQKVNNRIGDDL
jgi:hypothetical protein